LDDVRPQAAALGSLAGLLRVVAGSGQVLALRAREVHSDVECNDILDPVPLHLVAAALTNYSRGADAGLWVDGSPPPVQVLDFVRQHQVGV